MKTLILDFDGVIVDSEKFAKDIITNDMKIPLSDEDFMAHHDGNVFEKPKIAFANSPNLNYEDIYLKKIEKLKSFFTVKQIENISKDYELFIISSNKEKVINKFLQNKKMSPYFRKILGSEFNKSKIFKFNYIIDSHKKKSEIIFITDTLGDIIEANTSKIKTIAVDFGFHPRERLEKGNPFKIVSSINELIEYLDRFK